MLRSSVHAIIRPIARPALSLCRFLTPVHAGRFSFASNGLALLSLVLQVMRELRCQHALSQLFCQLPGQARFAENRLRILVLNLRQQSISS